MLYNIYFELSALTFLIVLNVYMRLQYSSEPVRNRRFKALALTLAAAVSLDIVTAVTISYAYLVPVWLNTALNTLYLASDLLLEYRFILYCVMCVGMDAEKGVVMRVQRIVTAVGAVVLAVNVPTGFIFSFTRADGYVHGPFYYAIHALPLATVAGSIIIFLTHFGQFRKNQRFSLLVYIAVLISGPVVQLIFPNVLFFLFSVSVGFVMLMFSLETPDYQALVNANKALSQARDEANEAMNTAQLASRAKTDFLSAMSHDVRTPINAILGYNERIISSTNEEETARCSEKIRSAGKTLLSVVNNAIDYTEMDSGAFAIENAPYSTAAVLHDAAACAEHYAQGKPIELRFEADPRIPSVLSGDGGRLTQILNNLLSNAVKFTEDGWASMSASWEQEDESSGFLRVSIRDSGAGMSREAVRRVERDALVTESAGKRGAGMGLPIVTRLLALMGSTLELDSAPDRGTCAQFRVRQDIVDPTPVGELSLTAESAAAAPCFHADVRILCADDNAMNLELMRGNLARMGALVETARNGAEALEMIRRRRYDLVFLDHMMPVMDGMRTMEQIRRERLCPDTPVVVVTANALSGDREKYLAAGFAEYLAKPLSSQGLFSAVRRLLPPHLVRERAQASAAAKAPLTGVDALHKMGFLDTRAGLAYCCENVDFYLDIVRTYLSEDKSADILRCRENGDTEGFRILVHALKSTSRTIGAAELSAQAERLEAAARGGDEEYLAHNTARVVEAYRGLLKRLAEVLGEASKAH